MLGRVKETFAGFVDYLHDKLSIDPLMALPAVILLLSWPMFQVLFDDRAEAFMCAFVLAMAVRFALRLDVVVLRLRRSVSPKTIALLVLLAGPGILALLIWQGQPIWCQRFLTAYFLILAALHMLDVIDDEHRLIKATWPSLILPRAARIMSQVMVIYYMGMVLLNETLIVQVDPVIWLAYFGVLPLMSRLIVASLYETVKTGVQGAS